MIKVLQIISDTNIGGGGRTLLNYLSCQDKSRCTSHVVLPRNSALKERIEALGVPVYEIDAMADKSMDFKAIAPLRKVIAQVKPDLIHTHGSMAGRIAARACGKKVIYTKHCAFAPGAALSSLPGRMAGRVVDTLLSDGVIAVGPSAKEVLMQAGVPAHKIHQMMNGLEPLKKAGEEQRNTWRRECGFEPEDFVLGILARVEVYKGHDTLFDAARQLLAEGRRVKLLVAGDGSDLPRLRERAKAFPEGTVHFAGFVRDVERALSCMDVQINASTESETSSLSIIEGMSIGLPAAVSDIGGNPVLIRDGENGFLFPKGDSASLAQCVRRLMEDRQLWTDMSRRAEEIFEENYTGQQYAKQIENVYESVLKGANHGR